MRKIKRKDWTLYITAIKIIEAENMLLRERHVKIKKIMNNIYEQSFNE